MIKRYYFLILFFCINVSFFRASASLISVGVEFLEKIQHHWLMLVDPTPSSGSPRPQLIKLKEEKTELSESNVLLIARINTLDNPRYFLFETQQDIDQLIAEAFDKCTGWSISWFYVLKNLQDVKGTREKEESGDVLVLKDFGVDLQSQQSLVMDVAQLMAILALLIESRSWRASMELITENTP